MSMHNHMRNRPIREWLIWSAGALAAVVFVIPVLWALSASLRQTGKPWDRASDWIPSPLAWENYGTVFDTVDAARFALNSLLVVVIAAPLTVLLCLDGRIRGGANDSQMAYCACWSWR